jgi:hypothetical protein
MRWMRRAAGGAGGGGPSEFLSHCRASWVLETPCSVGNGPGRRHTPPSRRAAGPNSLDLLSPRDLEGRERVQVASLGHRSVL